MWRLVSELTKSNQPNELMAEFRLPLSDSETPHAMNIPDKCPKCDGEMQEGFILDVSHDRATIPSSWVAGKPEPSFWFGTKIGGKVRCDIQSYRCRQCGYLESYAKES